MRNPSLAFALSLIATAVLAAGCASTDQNAVAGSSRLGGDNGYGSYGRYGSGQAGASAMLKNEVGDLVYFASDSSDLTPEAERTLASQARFLGQHLEQAVTIEGHADERGTREYNIALGARRANAVKSFLVAQGVNGARVRVLSFGKERPVATCDDISCWSQNRRAQTVLNGTRTSQR
jgi:peptidoglycan-associated lipoprotein